MKPKKIFLLNRTFHLEFLYLKKRSVYHKMQNSHHVIGIGGVHNSLIPLNRANTYWTRSCKDGVVVVVVVNPWNVSFYPAGPFVHRFIMQLPPFHRSAGGGRGDQGKAVN